MIVTAGFGVIMREQAEAYYVSNWEVGFEGSESTKENDPSLSLETDIKDVAYTSLPCPQQLRELFPEGTTLDQARETMSSQFTSVAAAGFTTVALLLLGLAGS